MKFFGITTEYTEGTEKKDREPSIRQDGQDEERMNKIGELGLAQF